MEIIGFIILFIIFSISDAMKGDTSGLEIIAGVVALILGMVLYASIGIGGLFLILVIVVAIILCVEGGKKK